MKIDKFYHFTSGFMIAIITLVWCMGFEVNPKISNILLMITPLIGGLLKEVYDKIRGGKFDLLDMTATIIGGWIISIPMIL